ncbi:ankyrin repeat domain-containing protein 6-like [Corticium candelabrum]|uniref:ankyrin repeat domain-containing protein 6-like n=1 Tax=Corticium candelabrum TaxID=121492 RepID=UPI002E263A3F|nr:ankyrin repeat domain-containing protein 6-like [Corticium candelabrum]
MMAAFHGYDSLIVMLLSSNADGNLKTKDGWTALHYAAFYNHSKVVRVLLENGCDMNIINNSGETALQLAVRLKRKDAADAIKAFTVSSPTASSASVVPNSSKS